MKQWHRHKKGFWVIIYTAVVLLLITPLFVNSSPITPSGIKIMMPTAQSKEFKATLENCEKKKYLENADSLFRTAVRLRERANEMVIKTNRDTIAMTILNVKSNSARIQANSQLLKYLICKAQENHK